MAFTETNRVAIRHFVGFGALFLQAEPRLESAITTVQSIADGGTRPDNSTETAILAMLVDAALIETKLKALWDLAEVTGPEDEATLDPFRGMVHLRSEGRRICGHIAMALGMRGVRTDAFGNPTVVIDDNPFGYRFP